MESNVKELELLVDEISTQLAENFFNTVQILSRIVTSTEKYYDGSHSRFVSEKSAQVAEELGMSDEDVMEIKIAGLLHDIGKLGFTETMLFKYPNELSESDYNLYLRHPEMGMQILKPHAAFDTIGKIIYQHHERIDGSGFPNHTRRDDIHPGAKIIIVVDYYHNMIFKKSMVRGNKTTSDIQYNSTNAYLTTTQERYSSTLNYLNKKKGVLFEKKVVDIFIDLVESERRTIGHRSIMRVPVTNLEPGLLLAEDYYTSYGMLIAAKGEQTTKENINALRRFADNGEIPMKLLVMK